MRVAFDCSHILQVAHRESILQEVVQEFEGVTKQESLQLLQQYAKQLPALEPAEQSYENIVMGCTTQVTAYTMSKRLAITCLCHYTRLDWARHMLVECYVCLPSEG